LTVGHRIRPGARCGPRPNRVLAGHRLFGRWPHARDGRGRRLGPPLGRRENPRRRSVKRTLATAEARVRIVLSRIHAARLIWYEGFHAESQSRREKKFYSILQFSFKIQ